MTGLAGRALISRSVPPRRGQEEQGRCDIRGLLHAI